MFFEGSLYLILLGSHYVKYLDCRSARFAMFFNYEQIVAPLDLLLRNLFVLLISLSDVIVLYRLCMRKVSVMFVKSFLKIMCVSVFGVWALVGTTLQSFSQSQGKLKDSEYAIHVQDVKNKKKQKSESGLVFTKKELNNWKVMQKTLTKRYEKRIDDLMSGRVGNVRNLVSNLRAMYPKTSYYDPFSTLIIKKLTTFAYDADMSTNPVESSKALSLYRDLLYKHIANFDVIEYALTLARANPVYGDELRLKEIRDVLMKDIKGREQNGASPDDAYRVVTYGEEEYLLALRKVTVKKSEVYRVENSFYDVVDVVDSDGNYSQLYFDVTWPIYLYEKNKAVKESAGRFSIPAQ